MYTHYSRQDTQFSGLESWRREFPLKIRQIATNSFKNIVALVTLPKCIRLDSYIHSVHMGTFVVLQQYAAKVFNAYVEDILSQGADG